LEVRLPTSGSKIEFLELRLPTSGSKIEFLEVKLPNIRILKQE